MLKLATLIENPGEPPAQSRYRDPQRLRDLGYNARMIYQSTALSGVASPDVIANTEMRRWVQQSLDQVGRTIQQTTDAGLEVYLCYDTLALAQDVVRRNMPGLTCKSHPDTLCPGSDQAVELSVRAVEAMLRRWPGVAGIVLRFGDTDARRMPHLLGNDIYAPRCPRCSRLDRAGRVVRIIEAFHKLVVRQMDKRLIARAWNVRPGGLHDSPELCRQVVDKLPGEPDDDRLTLMFKFTQTDFWRYQKWNPSSLVCGDRPVIYELQCQREFEGKGGIPNWQAPLWRDGYPESRDQTEVAGLAQASEKVNLAGLCAWVRGGGWGGPFVNDETWIDANVYAVPRLADDPKADPEALGRAWIADRLGVTEPGLMEVLLAVLGGSAAIARDAFYIGPFATGKADPWHPSGDWISDDLLDARAAWRMIQRVPESKLEEVVAEKQRAADAVSELRRKMQQAVGDRNHARLEPLVNTMLYTESLVETLRDFIAGLVAYRRFEKQAGAGDIARVKLFSAQAHWNHHAQRAGSFSGAATPFREAEFWELTQEMLVKVTG